MRVGGKTMGTYSRVLRCKISSVGFKISLIKPHSNAAVPPASVPGRSLTVGDYLRTQSAVQLSGSNVYDVAEFADWKPEAPKKWMPTPAENGGDTEAAEHTILEKKKRALERTSGRNGWTATPGWNDESAEAIYAEFEARYARASPCAGWSGRRAVPFAPDRAASPPCSRVALLACAGRFRHRGKGRRCTPTRATRARAHCGTVRTRTMAWPALGFVRRACDGARVLAALGGSDSSGVACGGTSSEEAEAYHARATVNQDHA